ncbi:MAG: hypothetical protein ACFFG0_00235 [Candidatus Thorarchaeota archaeon]
MLVLCGYGCGQKANYPPRKGMTKWCCEVHYNKCPHQIEIKTKLALESGKLFGRTPWNKGTKGLQEAWNKGKKWSKKTIEKMSKSSKLDIKQIKKRYPLFSKIEEMRYNPDKSGEKEIQVHCKNHLCENSREKSGWFTPTYIQIYERIRQLEKEDGKDGCYFYCSEKCKTICPLFNLKSDPFKETKKLYTKEEYEIFKQHVLERDDYKCQYCDKQATDVHHERPQKLESFFVLDPDFAWSCCEKCHYKYGHKTGTECSTGSLASKNC